MSERESWIIPGSVMVRPDEKGQFDELFLYDGDGNCLMHAEMMDDGCLWVGLMPVDKLGRSAVMWINAKGKKLEVVARED